MSSTSLTDQDIEEWLNLLTDPYDPSFEEYTKFIADHEENKDQINKYFEQYSISIPTLSMGTRMTSSMIDSKTSFKNFASSKCCICIEICRSDNYVFMFPCNHNIHIKCLRECLQTSHRECPVCKTVIGHIVDINDNVYTISEFLNIYPDGIDITIDHTSSAISSQSLTSAIRITSRSISSPLGISRSITSPIGVSNYQTREEFRLKESIAVVKSTRTIHETSKLKLLWDSKLEIDDKNVGVFVVETPNVEEEYLDSDIIIMLDNSGSMQNCLSLCKTILREVIKDLKKGQRLSLMTFESLSRHIIPLRIISQNDITTIEKLINEIKSEGGTNYQKAWNSLIEIANDSKRTSDDERNLTVIWLTDGEPSQDLSGLNQYDVSVNTVNQFYTLFPLVSFNIISIGDNVRSEILTPKLLCNSTSRGDLGQYFHCENASQIRDTLDQITGGVSNIHSKSLVIRFNKDIVVHSSSAKKIDDETVIEIPFMKMSDNLDIVCEFPTSMNCDYITCEYQHVTPEGDILEIAKLEHQDLPDRLTTHYINRRFTLLKLEKIHNSTISKKIKTTQLRTIKDASTIIKYGEYLQEVLYAVDTYLEANQVASLSTIPGYRQKSARTISNQLEAVRSSSISDSARLTSGSVCLGVATITEEGDDDEGN